MPFLLRCQGGEAFYLAVTQILILLIVRAQQRYIAVLLLLVLLLHYGEGKRCPNFRRWCRLYDAVFTAVGAAITLRRG